jgi:hypothetical protein
MPRPLGSGIFIRLLTVSKDAIAISKTNSNALFLFNATQVPDYLSQ